MMKTNKKIFVLMILAMLIGLVAGTISASAASKSKWSFAIANTIVTMEVDEVINLEPNEFAAFELRKSGKKVNASEYTVKWKSSNTSLLFVDAKNGKARAAKNVSQKDLAKLYGQTAKVTATFTNVKTKAKASRSFTVRLVEKDAAIDFGLSDEAKDLTITEEDSDMGFFDKVSPADTKQDNTSFTPNPNERRSETIVFSDIPETLEAFKALPQAAMNSPFDTAAMTVVALCVYTKDKDLGISMLNFLKGPQELSPYELQFLRDRLTGKDYVPRSYFVGAIPGNDYMPSSPYSIIVFDNPYSYQEDTYANLYITSGGADSARSVKMRKAKDGKWYLWEQFLLPDIRKPESTNPWA